MKTKLAIFLAVIISLSLFFYIGTKSISIAFETTNFANESLLARAGGGESYGGGGYDSSSSSSSSSSSGSDYGSSSSSGSTGSGNPTVTCCIILIIILAIVIDQIIKRRGGKGFINYSKNGTAVGSAPMQSNSTPNVTNNSMTAEEIKASLEQLKVIDPDFDEQKFKTHVKKVFMAVQEGWTNRDQKVCRPFMGEEVYQSHQMQVENMLKNKTINVLENIVVGATDFAKIELGTDFHKITMKMRAAMKDYKVKEDNPNIVIELNKDQQPPFTEYWAFIRKSNLKTKVKDGIFDRKCPNCGAPIDVDVAGTCKYCNANVVNGDFDWVLSEIIQMEEFN